MEFIAAFIAVIIIIIGGTISYCKQTLGIDKLDNKRNFWLLLVVCCLSLIVTFFIQILYSIILRY